MNKYIITHEKIKMQNREEQDFIVSALYNQGKKMIEVSLTPQMKIVYLETFILAVWKMSYRISGQLL